MHCKTQYSLHVEHKTSHLILTCALPPLTHVFQHFLNYVDTMIISDTWKKNTWHSSACPWHTKSRSRDKKQLHCVPDDPLPHAASASCPTVCPRHVLVVLRNIDVVLRAKALDTPKLASTVTALGNAAPLLGVLQSQPAK
jgi:hypothetical protein